MNDQNWLHEAAAQRKVRGQSMLRSQIDTKMNPEHSDQMVLNNRTPTSIMSRKATTLVLPDFSRFTLANLASLPSHSANDKVTTKSHALDQLRSPISKYTERVVDEILVQIFVERRGDFSMTSSSCEKAVVKWVKSKKDLHVDTRLKYWREMMQRRRKLQLRVQKVTGKNAAEVLFNRRTTLENRNEQMVKRLLEYAERMRCDRLMAKPVSTLREFQDPCTCQIIQELRETLPKAERVGYKDVEIIGVPNVIKRELLGREAVGQELRHGWLKSSILDKHLERRFCDIHNVLDFFPDLDDLQVSGISVERLRGGPKTPFVDAPSLKTISKSSSLPFVKECECEEDIEEDPMPTIGQPEVAQVGLRINSNDYIPAGAGAAEGLNECYELLTKFSCDPFERSGKHILRLTNIGQQTLSFTWKQGVYYYNRGSLLLAKDNEFLFDIENFRLTHGETRNLVVVYQPRKVGVTVELWSLTVEPRVFCSGKESLMIRLHGCCTPPEKYSAKLRELHCTAICKGNTEEVFQLTTRLGTMSPLIVPQPACCPYECSLDEREIFNALNPGHYCFRFDDLEVLKALHEQLKKPRERKWDLRLNTIKEYITSIESFDNRERSFRMYTGIVVNMVKPSCSLDNFEKLDTQKQRTRFIYVRGVICNGIEEWQDLICTLEDSFLKPELQRYYISLIQKVEEEEENGVDAVAQGNRCTLTFTPADLEKLLEIYAAEDVEHPKEEIKSIVMSKLYHSKYFRDALFIQTYSHLCNIAEYIVSVIESTDIVPI
ncbi:uncharacterized protein DMAD_11115 [Drosophila madeirensis]|uniref:MYCBP-associated protein n=1 Tax=Drosophila madeirensis TaxID=30013 RepID=A0AAU9FC82_DROMD